MTDSAPHTPAASRPSSSWGRLIWAWGPAIAMMAAIVAASSIQNLDELPGGVSDKTAHFWSYFVLGVLVLRGTSRATWRGVTIGAAVLAWIICAAFGASDEWHQFYVPGREADVVDWLADTSGAAAGAAVVWALARARRRTGRTV